MEHQKFLVSDKYEQSYSLPKSIENLDFPGSGAGLYADEQHSMQICRDCVKICGNFFIPSFLEFVAENLNPPGKIHVICAEIEEKCPGRF